LENTTPTQIQSPKLSIKTNIEYKNHKILQPMGLILSVTWDSDENNLTRVHLLQDLVTNKFANFSPKVGEETNETTTFLIKQVTKGCGTCGDYTSHARRSMEAFRDYVVTQMEGVQISIRDAEHKELV